jgi:hypothetical protein
MTSKIQSSRKLPPYPVYALSTQDPYLSLRQPTPTPITTQKTRILTPKTTKTPQSSNKPSSFLLQPRLLFSRQPVSLPGEPLLAGVQKAQKLGISTSIFSFFAVLQSGFLVRRASSVFLFIFILWLSVCSMVRLLEGKGREEMVWKFNYWQGKGGTV